MVGMGEGAGKMALLNGRYGEAQGGGGVTLFYLPRIYTLSLSIAKHLAGFCSPSLTPQDIRRFKKSHTKIAFRPSRLPYDPVCPVGWLVWHNGREIKQLPCSYRNTCLADCVECRIWDKKNTKMKLFSFVEIFSRQFVRRLIFLPLSCV